MNRLKIKIVTDDKSIINKYERQIEERNPSDAGFDLYIPDDHHLFKASTSHCIDHKVQIEYINESQPYSASWDSLVNIIKPLHILMIPRSSMAKTTIRLSNSLGLIDSGYRGNLKAFVDNLGHELDIDKGTSLFQLIVGEDCHVEIVKELTPTLRAEKGFGSTGDTLK